jgi:hypothetical protein
MNCSCDYEPSDVWTMDKVRARKPWACCECRGRILPGEHYTRVSSLYDGRWSKYRRCGDCMVIACDLQRLPTDGEFCFCDLWEGMVAEITDALGYSAENYPLLLPIVGAFNAASKARGGITIDITPYQPEEESP